MFEFRYNPTSNNENIFPFLHEELASGSEMYASLIKIPLLLSMEIGLVSKDTPNHSVCRSVIRHDLYPDPTEERYQAF